MYYFTKNGDFQTINIQASRFPQDFPSSQTLGLCPACLLFQKYETVGGTLLLLTVAAASGPVKLNYGRSDLSRKQTSAPVFCRHGKLCDIFGGHVVGV